MKPEICADCGKEKEEFHTKKNLFCKDVDAKPLQKWRIKNDP